MSRLWFSAAAPLASTLGVLLLTQIALGIINVVEVLPLYIAIGHNLIAACLLLAMFTLIIWPGKNDTFKKLLSVMQAKCCIHDAYMCICWHASSRR